MPLFHAQRRENDAHDPELPANSHATRLLLVLQMPAGLKIPFDTCDTE